MNALAIFLEYYQGNIRAISEHVAFFTRAGVVRLDADACLLAYQVPADSPPGDIVNLSATGPILTDSPETWHIHLATGDLAEVRKAMEDAFPKAEFLTFQREGGRLRRFKTEQLKRLTRLPHGIRKAKTPAEASTSNESSGSDRSS